MSDTEYVTISRYYTPKGGLRENRELQITSDLDEDEVFDSSGFTAMRVYSRDTGDPVSGEAVLSPDELAQLYRWAGQRLAELRHPDAPAAVTS